MRWYYTTLQKSASPNPSDGIQILPSGIGVYVALQALGPSHAKYTFNGTVPEEWSTNQLNYPMNGPKVIHKPAGNELWLWSMSGASDGCVVKWRIEVAE